MDAVGPITRDFSQKTLRQWKRQHKAHRSFTVLRHPVARLHAAFCDLLVFRGDDPQWDLKHALRKNYEIALPDEPNAPWSLAAHRAAFLNFIGFVGKTLSGQTGISVDPSWASQTETIKGFADFALPDHILREDRLTAGLDNLLSEVAVDAATDLPAGQPDAPFPLAQVYSDEIEDAVRKLYQRDYVMFGFRPWGKQD